MSCFRKKWDMVQTSITQKPHMHKQIPCKGTALRLLLLVQHCNLAACLTDTRSVLDSGQMRVCMYP